MRSQFLLKVSKDRWGRGRGVPTWVTLLCKSHYVDPVQIVFLWEKRIEGYTPGWRCEGVRDGLRAWNGNGRRGAVGGGGWWADTEAQGGTADKDWEEVMAFDKWVCKTGKCQLQKDVSPERASLLWSGGPGEQRGKATEGESEAGSSRALRAPRARSA